MTAVTEQFRKIGICGDLKIISIRTDSSASNGDTIDLNTDITDGKGRVISDVINTIVQGSDGSIKSATFDSDTGIITLEAITPGVQNITIIGY